ncbi:MAG: hypothetical protein HW389_1816 [Bacteroidetes bacterium]|nr:hypothetical protein [Bacteroidota bacterium]
MLQYVHSARLFGDIFVYLPEFRVIHVCASRSEPMLRLPSTIPGLKKKPYAGHYGKTITLCTPSDSLRLFIDPIVMQFEE